jgi:hypothetical protein
MIEIALSEVRRGDVILIDNILLNIQHYNTEDIFSKGVYVVRATASVTKRINPNREIFFYMDCLKVELNGSPVSMFGFNDKKSCRLQKFSGMNEARAYLLGEKL